MINYNLTAKCSYKYTDRFWHKQKTMNIAISIIKKCMYKKKRQENKSNFPLSPKTHRMNWFLMLEKWGTIRKLK